MKKIISLLLALTMLLSCVFVTAGAEDATNPEEENSTIDDIISDVTNMENFQNSIINASSGFVFPEDGDMEVDEMIAANLIQGEMLGISVDFLYNSPHELFWKDVTVSKDDIALAKGNLNSYLKRVLNEKYGGFKLYTMENNAASINATKIANFLGNLFYPDFKEVTIQFQGNETIDEDVFYGEIVQKSGFGALLHNNWCNQGRVDFRPLLEIWGLSLENVLNSEFRDGYRLGKKLLAAAINKFMSEGPVNAALEIINIYSKSYVLFLYDATLSLFAPKLAADVIEPDELKTMEGLFNLIFNNNNHEFKNSTPNYDTSKLQFVTMPSNRFRMAKDTTELFLYIIIYSNINCRFRNNAAVIEGMKGEDARINSAIDVFLKGDLNEFVADLSNLFMENIQQAPNDIFSSILNTISKFIKMIADYFDNLFAIITGEKEYPRP